MAQHRLICESSFLPFSFQFVGKHQLPGIFFSFYFVNDRLASTRTFDDQRLNFVPCSLYLALQFARDVLEHELSDKASKPQANDDDDVDLISEDTKIHELVEHLQKKNCGCSAMKVSSELIKRSKAIVDAVRAGKPLPLSAELLAQEDFVQGLKTRVLELIKDKLNKVSSVAITDYNMSNLNPYSLRRVGLSQTAVTRENYRISNRSEKQCALFNAASLEHFNFLSSDEFFDKIGNPSKKRKAPLNYKELFSRLSDHGPMASWFTTSTSNLGRSVPPLPHNKEH